MAVFGLGLIIYQAGDRRLTIEFNGQPAAGMELEQITSGEVMTLDESGSVDLAWGLSAQQPYVWFKTGRDSNWVLQLPARGHRIYRFRDTELTQEDLTLDLGVLQIRESWTQSGGMQK